MTETSLSRKSILRLERPSAFTISLWVVIFASTFLIDSKLQESMRFPKEAFQFISLGFLIFAAIWKSSSECRFFRIKSTSDWMLLLCLISSMISWGFSPNPAYYLFKVMNLLVHVLFIFVLREYFEGGADRNSIFIAFVITSFFSSIYGIFQYNGLDFFFKPLENFDEARWLVAGFIGQQTLLAGVIGPIAPLSIAAGLQTRNRAIRGFFFGCAVVILIAVVLTHTRAILLGYLAALLFASIIFLMQRQRKMLYRTALFLIAFALLLTLASRFVPSLKKRISDGFDLQSSSVNARMRYWNASMLLIEQKPWFGWGFGAFQIVYPPAQIELQKQTDKYGVTGSEIVTHPHNEAIAIFVDGGIFLLSIYSLSTVIIFIYGLRKYLLIWKDFQGPSLLFCLMSFIIILMDAMFSFPFHIAPSALLLIFLISYLIADIEPAQAKPGLPDEKLQNRPAQGERECPHRNLL